MSAELKKFLSLFKDTKKAYKILLTITTRHRLLMEFSDAMESLYLCLKRSCERDISFSHFEEFLSNSTMKSTIFELIKSFPVTCEVLFGIFSQSNTLSMFLSSNPENLFWLIEKDTLGKDKNKEDFIRDAKNLLSTTTDPLKKEYLLRIFRKREYLRIATREIINACSFEQVMRELSLLANATLEIAIDIAREKLSSRYKNAGREICIVGMGKLGSGELNFSSDIDIIFVHKDPSEAEYYNKLAASIVSIISSESEGGYVFRVDTNLRPGGKYYPLSLTPEEYEYYYNTFGQTWEKMALLRANFSAGDYNLFEAFKTVVDGFIYSTPVDARYIEEIRSLLSRIKKYSRHTNNTGPIPGDRVDVKKGVGGIRELEFLIHYFQLIYGKEHPELRHGSTAELLSALNKLKFINQEKKEKLLNYYMFLRRTEHKLQLLNERQTQTLPTDDDDLKVIGCKLGVSDFVREYMKATDYIHDTFKELFVSRASLPVFGFEEDIEEYLKEKGIENSGQLAHTISSIARKWNAENLNSTSLRSLMDYMVSTVPLPELLSNAIGGLSRIPILYVPTIQESEGLTEVLTKVLSMGYGGLISEHPSLMEEFFSLNEKPAFSHTSKAEKVRLEFSVILRLLAFGFDMEYLRTLTRFAEFTIKEILHKHSLEDLIILGLGKLGIKEIFKGSDLDIVLLADDPSSVEVSKLRNFIRDLKKIYEVDLKLRPFGDKGPLIVAIDYLREYFSSHARTWEHLAYQKSRLITGARDDVASLLNGIVSKQLNKNDIKNMKLKIEQHKAQGMSIKSSPGGVTDIEFISQYLAFKHNVAKPGVSAPILLRNLNEYGAIDGEKTELLTRAYNFYTSLTAYSRAFSDAQYLSDKNLTVLEYITGQSNIKNKILSQMKTVRELFEEVFS